VTGSLLLDVLIKLFAWMFYFDAAIIELSTAAVAASSSAQQLKADAVNAQLALLCLDSLCYVCIGSDRRDACAAALLTLLPVLMVGLKASNGHVITSSLLALGM